MRRFGFTMALLALLLGGGSLWAEDTVWERSCRFSTEVDGGKPRPGTVYERKGTPEMLGQLPDNTWFLLQPQERRVLQLAEGQVKLAADSPQATLSGQEGTGSAVRLTPSALTFDVAGKFVKVLPTPPLLGEVEAEDFLALCPDYRDRVNTYAPDSKTVTRLSAAGGKRTVEVFFGSWCPHCQQVLPKLIKSLQLADNAKIDVKWIGLPRMFLNEPMVREREIKGVPTIIVLEDGREIGRFSGVEKIPVEVSLANLVQPG